MAETHPVVLIDLSSIAHPIFHMSASEPDPNWTSTQIVARIRALASGQPHVAICCDSGKSFRAEIDPTYKANRPESDATLHHQIALAVETLRGDGFPVWAVKGFEADDVIASAVKCALEDGSTPIAWSALIVSADKDLLQLVGPRVQAKSLRDGSLIDADAVVAKFGVTPEQIGDYLALVGDASDNIKGAKGIGPKRAADLLAKHGTLAAILATGGAGMTPAVRDALVEFAMRADTVRALIALRTDVSLPFNEVFKARVPVTQEETMADETTSEATAATEPASPESRGGRAVDTSAANTQHRVEAEREAPRPVLVPQVLPAPAPAEWSMQLEPRSIDDAWRLAQRMHESRLFSAYGTPSAVLSTILAGREIGLQAMASLRAFHIIEGKPTLSAGIIQAMVLKSPHCRYFRCTARSNEAATFVGKRGDAPEVSLTFSIEDAKLANGGTLKAGSGWVKNPADMCVARAATKLARLLWPDVTNGLYAPEEME